LQNRQLIDLRDMMAGKERMDEVHEDVEGMNEE
jgi:hypothetical protein